MNGREAASPAPFHAELHARRVFLYDACSRSRLCIAGSRLSNRPLRGGAAHGARRAPAARPLMGGRIAHWVPPMVDAPAAEGASSAAALDCAWYSMTDQPAVKA